MFLRGRFMTKLLVILLVVILAVCVFIFCQPGGFLIVNNPEKSDAIVVLGGDAADQRYARGMELLRAGYARRIFVDATTGVTYGHSYVDLAREYVGRTAGVNASQVSVCPIVGDSTKVEAQQVNICLQTMQPPPRSVILATDSYHTRRALSIFRTELPQYKWTAAAADVDFLFGLPWWKEREWAKTYVTEWEKLLWWELVDRWHK
jgi:uncharacterized SAM-binding protein YcdF (DUF218 family)